MKLYATLETSRGKQVSISDNEQITATVFDGNMKAFSVIIEFANIGDPEGSEKEGGKPCMGAIITTREWRNRPKTNDRKNPPVKYHQGARYIDCALDNKNDCSKCGWANR